MKDDRSVERSRMNKVGVERRKDKIEVEVHGGRGKEVGVEWREGVAAWVWSLSNLVLI